MLQSTAMARVVVLLLLVTTVALTDAYKTFPTRVCPVNDLLPRILCLSNAQDACSSDAACSWNQRCCSYGCVRQCVTTCKKPCGKNAQCLIKEVRFGLTTRRLPAKCITNLPSPSTRVCPVNDLLPRILCFRRTPDACSSDKDCPGNKRCCSYGCARQCVTTCEKPCGANAQCLIKEVRQGLTTKLQPAKCTPNSPSPSTRVCPLNDLLPRILCLGNAEDACSSDATCSGNQRCCSYGCVRQCVTTCEKPCGKNAQCLIKEVRFGLTTRRLTAKCIPNLPSPSTRVCPVNDLLPRILCSPGTPDSCSSDKDCCGNKRRCCSYGCAKQCVTTCEKPCEKNAQCLIKEVRQGLTTKLQPAKCIPNPPSPSTRVCPVNDLAARMGCQVGTRDSCSSDKDCSGNQRCCSYGCARQCVTTCEKPCGRNAQCLIKEVFDGLSSKRLPAKCIPNPPNPCAEHVCPPGKSCVLRGGPPECL